MAEYIEREAVINVVANNPYNVAFKTSKTIQEIEKLQSADVVEVKQGYWKEVNQIGRGSRHIQYTTKQCSVCGYWNGRKKTNYCPECGAKMDLKGGADNE